MGNSGSSSFPSAHLLSERSQNRWSHTLRGSCSLKTNRSGRSCVPSKAIGPWEGGFGSSSGRLPLQEFVLRFRGPCLASGQTHATAVTPFTYVTPQSVVGADGGYLIPSISSARAGAVHAQASHRRPRWGVSLCVQVLPSR